MLINLYDAKTHLSELVEQAAAGEEVVIAKAGRPRVRLVPVSTGKVVRKPGVWQGQIFIADDFDAPLPPDVLRGFAGDDEGPGTDRRRSRRS